MNPLQNMTSRLKLFSILLAISFFFATPALAHRVNIFAYVSGNDIIVECGFNRSQKVKQGNIQVVDATTNTVILTGKTDDKGVFTFPISQEIRRAGHDLSIRIIAGEGHQNDWTVAANELMETPQNVSVSAPAPVLSTASVTPQSAPQNTITPDEVERIINTALDTKLAPIKKMLAEQTEAAPDIKDIIGGIGWIFGLAGIVAYFRRRR